MITIRDIKIEQEEQLNTKEDTRTVFPAVTVAVNGSVIPSNRANGIWVVEEGKSLGSAMIVANPMGITQAGVPVLVGPAPKSPYRYSIIEYNSNTDGEMGSSDPSDQGGSPGQLGVPNHGPKHQWPTEDNPGIDAVKTYQPALQMFKTTGNGSNLSVAVQPLIYTYGASRRYFSGGNLDLTSFVPGAGLSRYALIYLAPATNAVGVVSGSTVPESTQAPAPIIPDEGIPSALVYLTNGQTAITTATHVTDARSFLNGGVSSAGGGGAGDIISEGDSSVEVIDDGTGQVIITVDGNAVATFDASGLTMHVGDLGGSLPFDIITVDETNPDADYDNLLDALNAADFQDVIMVGPGFYVLEEYALQDDVYIIGSGMWNTWIENTSSFVDHIIDISIGDLYVYNLSFWLSNPGAASVAQSSIVASDSGTGTIEAHHCSFEIRNLYASSTSSVFRGSMWCKMHGGFLATYSTGTLDEIADSNDDVSLQFYEFPRVIGFDQIGGDSGNTGFFFDEQTSFDVALKATAGGARIRKFVDEDDMVSDDPEALPTQQSVKAYVDSQTGGAGALPLSGGTMTGPIRITVSETVASGATHDIDMSASNVHNVTLDQACTFSVINPPTSGVQGSFVLYLYPAGFTPSFPGTFMWTGSSSIDTTNGTATVISVTTVDGGTSYFATLVVTGIS